MPYFKYLCSQLKMPKQESNKLFYYLYFLYLFNNLYEIYYYKVNCENLYCYLINYNTTKQCTNLFF